MCTCWMGREGVLKREYIRLTGTCMGGDGVGIMVRVRCSDGWMGTLLERDDKG